MKMQKKITLKTNLRRKERRVICVAGGERGEKKIEEAMGERAHVLLAIVEGQAVSLSRQGQRALLPRL